jgi:hypothetical protein
VSAIIPTQPEIDAAIRQLREWYGNNNYACVWITFGDYSAGGSEIEIHCGHGDAPNFPNPTRHTLADALNNCKPKAQLAEAEASK